MGPPGTGKSRVLTQLASELEKQGHNVAKICLAHVASSHIGGQTAHAFCLKRCLHGSFKGIVLIDEISMVPLPLLASLEQLRRNCTFLSAL